MWPTIPTEGTCALDGVRVVWVGRVAAQHGGEAFAGDPGGVGGFTQAQEVVRVAVDERDAGDPELERAGAGERSHRPRTSRPPS